MKNKKIIILIILFTIIGVLICSSSFAKYKSDYSFFSSSKTGKMVYDLYIEPKVHINEYNYSFFSVYIRNYKNDIMTDVNFSCNLNVTNKTANKTDLNYGYFGYKDSTGGMDGITKDNKPNLDNMTTIQYDFDKTAKKDVLINIIVDTENLLPQIVNYNLKLNCHQKLNMED